MVSLAIKILVFYYVAVGFNFLLVTDSTENLIKALDPLPIKYWPTHVY